MATAQPEYVSDKVLAQRYGVNRATIWNWVKRRDFPKPYKFTPQTTRWKLSEIEEWEDLVKSLLN